MFTQIEILNFLYKWLLVESIKSQQNTRARATYPPVLYKTLNLIFPNWRLISQFLSIEDQRIRNRRRC